MDYFHQLLESYDRLKKRKLKLRIQEAVNHQVEQKALQAISQAEQYQAKSYDAFKVPGVASNLFIFFTPKGRKFSNSATNEGGKWAATGFQKFIDKAYEEFLGYFDNGEGEESGGSAGAPQQPLQQPQMGQMNPEQVQPMASPVSIKLQEELAPILDDIKQNIPANIIDKSLLKDFNSFANAIFGLNGQSLESHLINAKKINRDGMGIISRNSDPVDPVLVERVTDKIVKIFNIISRSDEDLNADDKDFIESYLIMNKDGSVTISTNGDPEEGLNFSDKTGILKMLSQTLELKFGVTPIIFDIEKAGSDDSDNQFRGVNMEEILPLIQLIVRCENEAKMLDLHMRAQNKACKSASQLSERFKDKLKKMREVHSEWATMRETGAIDAEDIGTISFYNQMFGDENTGIFKALADASRKSLKVRRSDYALPIGAITGFGRRADVSELWMDQNLAIQGLKKSGFSDEKIQKMLKLSKVDKLISANREFGNFGVRSGILTRHTDVAFLNVSLKNYLNLDDAKLGSSTTKSFDDSLAGIVKKDTNSQKTFIEKIKLELGISENEFESIRQYSQELKEVEKKVIDLPFKATVPTGAENAKVIKVESFKELLDVTYDSITRNTNVKDLAKRGEVFELKSMIKEYREKSKEADTETGAKEVTDSLGENLRHRISLIASRNKLYKGLNSKDPNRNSTARKYLASKIFYSGASVDDGLLVDARGLITIHSFIMMLYYQY
jgi:hypothetical protein